MLKKKLNHRTDMIEIQYSSPQFQEKLCKIFNKIRRCLTKCKLKYYTTLCCRDALQQASLFIKKKLDEAPR